MKLLFHKEVLAASVRRLRAVRHPVVVVVGAHNGSVSERYLEKAPGCTLYAIEPAAKSYEKTKRKLGRFGKAKAYRVAISDHNGTETLCQIGGNISNSLYRKAISRKEGHVKKSVVKSLTLDKFISEQMITHIDLLRINCVGGEYKIFEAPTLDFLKITDTLVMEVHRIPPFDTQEFEKKRVRMYALAEKAGLSPVLGILRGYGMKFMSQLWIRR